MRIAYLHQNGFSVTLQDTPSVADNEVLVKTMGCGICGGDQHLYRVRDQAAAKQPLKLGHEGTGTVVALGRAVDGFGVGSLVTSLNGGFADYFVAPADYLAPLPPHLDPLTALGEPLACCLHACERTAASRFDRVAILGCGFMGLMCMQILRHQGAGEIIAFDPVDERRAMARQLGADKAVAPDDYRFADPDTGEFDIVIEAAGNQPVLDLAADLVKQHGKINLVGYHESNNGQRSVNMQCWNFKAIDVVNGHVRRDGEKVEAMKKGIALLADGSIETGPLITEYPFDQIETAFRDLIDGKPGLFKIVLVHGAA